MSLDKENINHPADPVQDIARQLGITTFGDGLLVKIRETIELLRQEAYVCQQYRDYMDTIKAQGPVATIELIQDGQCKLIDFDGMPAAFKLSTGVHDLYAAPAAKPHEHLSAVTDAMVSRFLGWKLPDDFYPDCQISFDREKLKAWPGTWPTGTNLLNATRAKEMLEHVIGVPSSELCRCVRYGKGNPHWPCPVHLVLPRDSLNGTGVDGWIACADQMPDSGRTVLAHYRNSHGKGRTIRAQYIKAWTVQAEDMADPDIECVEYSEQDDAYYLLEGWYECIDNWDDYSSVAVNEGTITHWMPLPAAPSSQQQEVK